MKRISPIYLVVAGMLATGSGTSNAQTGRSAYDFLEIPTSARAYGLGGTNITVIDDDVTLTDQNPALLGPEIDSQLAFNYMLYMQSGNFAGVRFGHSAGERGAWAAGIRYLNYGSIPGYEADGTPVGNFTPQDVVFEGTYSHDFTDRLRGGVNMKMIYSSYEIYNAFAMAVDVGINYYDDEKDLSLSAVLKNMGGQLKRFNDAYDRLPFDFQLGYMQGLGTTPFSLSITATHLTKWKLPYYVHDKNKVSDGLVTKSGFGSDLFRHLIFGLQFQPSDKFYIDLAYNYKTRTDMATYQRNFLSGFSLGLGFRLKSLRVDMAYAMPHKSASSFMLNLAYSFSDLMRQ